MAKRFFTSKNPAKLGLFGAGQIESVRGAGGHSKSRSLNVLGVKERKEARELEETLSKWEKTIGSVSIQEKGPTERIKKRLRELGYI